MGKLTSNEVNGSGVDLNRNYGFHYGEDPGDTDQCRETYRGPTAFSEPETTAIKNLVENEKTIASAMNFHCYGNIWIHPYNFMKVRGEYPKNALKEIETFYKEFKFEVAKVSKAKYGNAIETVGYSTDGEGSDWMLGEHNIISFSPELGSFNEAAQTFILPKDLIYSVIEENYKVIKLFMKRNNFELEKLTTSINNRKEFNISFVNRGLANIFSPYITITSPNEDFLSGITEATIHNEEADNTVVQINKENYHADKSITIQLTKINRLKKFTLSLKVSDPKLLQTSISLSAEIFMANRDSISKFEAKFEYERYSTAFIINAATIALLVILTTMALIWWNRKSKTAIVVSKTAVNNVAKIESIDAA